MDMSIRSYTGQSLLVARRLNANSATCDLTALLAERILAEEADLDGIDVRCLHFPRRQRPGSEGAASPTPDKHLDQAEASNRTGPR